MLIMTAVGVGVAGGSTTWQTVGVGKREEMRVLMVKNE